MRILVVRFSSLGDLVLTTPVYASLKKSYPGSFLALVTKEEYQELLAGNPYIDGFFILSRSKGLWSLIKQIRQAHFDLLIDLHNNIRSRLLGLFSGVPRQVRYSKGILSRWWLVWRKGFWFRPLHTVERYLAVLQQLGISPAVHIPELSGCSVSKNYSPKLRFLVVQTAFLGDAVLTLPLLSALKLRFPSSEVVVLTVPAHQEVFVGHPAVDRLLLYDKRGADRGLKAFFRWVKQLGKEGFTAALLPHRSLRSALMVRLAGIPLRIGFSRSQGWFFLNQRVNFHWPEHDLERNLRLLEPLGIFAPSEKKIHLIEKAREWAEDSLVQAGLESGDFLLGLNPGSRWETKRWPVEYFIRVGEELLKRFPRLKIAIFGGRDATDQLVAHQMNKAWETFPGRILNFAGKTTLSQMISLIRHCQIFLTNDSGPMHIAAACGVPVVAIFGPTVKDLGFYPYGEQHRIVEISLPCRPCGLHGGKHCPEGHFRCMLGITPEMVIKTIEELGVLSATATLAGSEEDR